MGPVSGTPLIAQPSYLKCPLISLDATQATATAAVLAGLLADKLQTGLGWSTVRVRRVMQSAATLGPALALVPVALGKDQVSVPLAVACLTGTLALQAFCYAGFHAYLQVCPFTLS